MEFEEFENLIKFGLSNLYDFAALETHPQLTQLFPLSSTYVGNKGDYLRTIFLETIDSCKPVESAQNINAPEWRTFIFINQTIRG